MKFTKDGRELPSSRPVEIPVGMQRPETLAEMVQRLVRQHVSKVAAAEAYETFEEANDFDVPDDSPELVNTRYQELTEEEPVERTPAPGPAPAAADPPAAPTAPVATAPAKPPPTA